ncbi:siderophore-interacting protein [Herbiconiux daphne]|uniref:Siderophore-interacting protein n=1 Tax=Herbiconiux daphne TaxID=2970914 RepID=A0ABT2H878_9MICO|nr:siderophore-interacting protein [Herbiconiux daphne]MCS5736129.1 siderophore-interacting protein [Herbiconiux daphne]
MLTYPAQTEIVRDDRPAYRPYRARVARIVRLSPSFTRVTFTCPEFETFGTAGLDQRIKIVLPHPDGTFGDAGWDDPDTLAEGTWYERWRALADHERNPFRTYTVRGIRCSDRELDVDFVVHGPAEQHGQEQEHRHEHELGREARDEPTPPTDAGPAARWLARAAEGDEIIVVGPDGRSHDYRAGLDWHPGDATDYLLAGDETAAPAICGILESLPAGSRAQAFICVPHADDAVEIVTDAEARVTWLARDSGDATLHDAVRAWVEQQRDRIAPALAAEVQEIVDIDVDTEMLWESPDDSSGRFYAWLAGESAVIKGLRRLLVSEIGVDRHRVAFMGYWRLGKAEGQ